MEPVTIQALLQPQAYPEPTARVDLLQTHVSFLFFTDTHVYKVKKPVDFGFLNFTSLDRRRFYCNEEVRLNRRLCPDIYLGVVELRDSARGASFTGDGEILDYAVKMKRLPERNMLHRLVADNTATDDHMRRVGEAIARFHLGAEHGVEIARFGDLAAIRHNWDENFQQLQPYSGKLPAPGDLAAVKAWGHRFMESNAERFASRVRDGFIRDCDGDIHLDNICIDETVCIFDCIEFNSRFRYSDVAADIAFLLMDLDFHGKRNLGKILLDKYITVTKDEGSLPLIPFYKCYRAMVRCKVEFFRLDDRQISDDEKDSARTKGAGYLRLARRYALRDRLPLSLVLICGLMGSGKSTAAAALSSAIGVDVISSDRVRKELTGTPADVHRQTGYDRGIYTPEMNARTYGELLQRAEKEIAGGESVIVDASFRRQRDRSVFRSLADRYEAACIILVTRCSDEVARQRLEERRRKPDEISDGRWELYHRQQSEFELPQPDEGNLIFVDTSGPINDTIDAILQQLGLLS